MNWTGKRTLVTGAGGFIGSHLTERLVSLGADTRALIHYNSSGSWGNLDDSSVKNDFQIFAGDVRDPDSISEAFKDVDVVFHLAAMVTIPYSYSAPTAYVRTNVEGTLNVLSTAQKSGVDLLIHTSSSEVYGSAKYVPMDESHPLQGQSPYSASKIGGDKMAEAFNLAFNLPVVTIRPFNTFGPRQSSRAIIPTIITQTIASSKIKLGNLEPTRDLTFISDTVDGFIASAEYPEAIGQTINLGTGQETSILNLASEIIKIIGNDIPVVQDEARLRPPESEVDRLCADNTKAMDLLRWRAQVSLKEGLLHTIEWVTENIDRFKVNTYAI